MFKYAILMGLLCVLLSAPASAGVIFDNGPDPGPAATGSNAWSINFGDWVSDSFTANGTQIGSVTFSTWWTNSGSTPFETPSSVEWAISTSPNDAGTDESGGFILASGANFFVGTATCDSSLSVCQAEVTIQLVPLIPASLTGTLWLTLEGEGFTGDNTAAGYWGQSSSGTSSAEGNGGALTGTTSCPVATGFFSLENCTSESFQIYDTGGSSGTGSTGDTGSPPPSTPEPGTLVLLGSGLLLTAGVLRRKARA